MRIRSAQKLPVPKYTAMWREVTLDKVIRTVGLILCRRDM